MSNIDNKKKELIESYLLGVLSEEDEKKFNTHMEDPAFQEALELQKEILETIEYQGDMRLKSMLVEEEGQIVKLKKNTSKKRFLLWRIAGIAASILLILYFAWQWQTTNPPDLFAQHFKPHVNTLYPGVKSVASVDPIRQSFVYYEKGDYNAALEGFEKIPSQEVNDDILFYQANVLLRLNKPRSAIPILQQIIQNKQTDYLVPAKWNLALAFVAQERYPDAKRLLEEIKEDSFYKSRVKGLLEAAIFME